MKKSKRTFTTLIFVFTIISMFGQVAINQDGSNPHASAMLDVSSIESGLLIPRMTKSQRDDIQTPAQGLMIFQTDDISGFYYWDGTSWALFGMQNSTWGIKGNTGTESTTDFIGTTDAQDLIFRTNNIERLRISQKGQLEMLNTGGSVFLGQGAGASDLHNNNYNVFIGEKAGNKNTSGGANTAIGYYSNYSSVLGYFNSTYGYMSLYHNTFGKYNTVNGAMSLYNNTTGKSNTVSGFNALYSNTTGSSNVALGVAALYYSTDKSNLVAIGDSALYNNGLNAPYPFQGTNNIAIGSKALYTNDLGRYNIATGREALYSNTLGSFNNAFGYNTLYSNSTGIENSAFGSEALYNNSDGLQNVALGNSTLWANTSGDKNTGIGYTSLYFNSTGNYNIAIGYKAGYDIRTGSNNIAIGNFSFVPSGSDSNQVNIANLIFATGADGGYGMISTGNVGIGVLDPDARLEVNGQIKLTGGGPGTGKVLQSDNSGLASWETLELNELNDADNDTKIQVEESSDDDKIRFDLEGTEFFVFDQGRIEVKNTGKSVFIGEGAGSVDDLFSNFNVYIGYHTGTLNISGNENTACGYRALTKTTGSSGNSAFGYQALASNTSGDYNTSLGYATLTLNTSGTYNVASGTNALYNNTSGSNNSAYGHNALFSNTTGKHNVSIGHNALYSNNASRNTACGDSSLFASLLGYDNTATGFKALVENISGHSNTATGRNSLYHNTSGDWNTAAGVISLFNNTTGYKNTAFGAYAFQLGNTYHNSTALGYNAHISASNMVKLGNSDVTWIGGHSAWQNTSDGRFKRNVKENVAGLAFILKLRPVTYSWDLNALDRFIGIPDSISVQSEDRTTNEQIIHTGFIAQEVEIAAQETGFEFDGVHHPANEKDPYTLAYAEFVVPLVKAIQEQQQMLEIQGRVIDELKAEVAALKKMQK